MITLDTAKNVLKKYGQEHILAYYEELGDKEKAELLSQIELIDFSVLENLNEENRHSSKRGKFEPLGCLVTIEDIDRNSDKILSCWCRSNKKR